LARNKAGLKCIFTNVKRFLILFLSYSLVFVVGYLVVGILAFYYKPELKMLPEFVEAVLPEPEPVYPDVQSLDGMEYRLVDAENQDTTIRVLFDDHYSDSNGIFCFRGNAQRNNPVRGVLEKRPTALKEDWSFTTATDSRVTKFGVWGGGSGWTGQPLAVKWPESARKQLHGLEPEFTVDNDFTEIIVGSLCGNIYFLDLETGKATRPHVSIHNPIKGTVSVDPRMNGLLYVGQGIPNGDRFGAYVFNMFTGLEILYRPGMDPDSRRLWGAFDSNSLIDPVSGYWFHPAENGQIYKTLVGKNGAISKPAKFNYSVAVHPHLGLEASFGAFKNLGFFGDNGGNVFCLNLMTMRPVWLIDNYDDTDASMVIECDEKNRPFLYIGNEVDKQGALGKAYIRKIDAMTGKEVWSVSRNCNGSDVNGRANSGGVLSTVLPGKNKAKNLVYGIFSRTNGQMGGEFVAIDKQTGKEQFKISMSAYSWASPIALYDREGNCFVFFTDVYGGIYLIDGLTGQVIVKQKMDIVFESSPIAWGNRIVVGARGNKILSFILE